MTCSLLQHHPLILCLLPLSSVKLKAFTKFENTTDALSAVTGLVEGKVPKNLKKFLETEISEKEMKKEKLIISDPKLGK
jgi:nucleolar protein 58